jgi:syntaxin 6
MSIDPYHQVQSDIQSSLQTAEQLRASFLRIRSTAREGNEELVLARHEVRPVVFIYDISVRTVPTLFPLPPPSLLPH